MHLIELYPSKNISLDISKENRVAFELDADAKFIYVSPNCFEVLEYVPLQLIGESIYSIIDQDAQIEFRNNASKATVDSEGGSFTAHVNRQNGSTIHEMFVKCIRDENRNVSGYYGHIIIAHENKTNESITDAEARFRDLFTHVTEGIFFFDPRDMRVIEMNPSLERILGYGSDELKNIPVYVFINEEKEIMDRQVAELMHTGVCALSTCEYIRKDGKILEVETAAHLFESGNTKLVTVIVQNVEERKKAEEVMRVFEERFRQFKDRVNDVIYRFNVKENSYEFVSPSILLQTGFSIEEFSFNTDEVLKRTTYPDDFPLIQHRIRQHLAKGITCGSIELQYRFVKKDGSVIWVSDHKSFEFDQTGNVEKVNGVMRDITQQKAIELRLRDSEEYFRTMFESSPDGLTIFDLPLTKFEINHQFTRLFGYEQFELQGNPWQILERVPPNIVQSRLDRLEREGTLEYNAIHFTKSGKVLYCNVKCSRFHTSKGPVYCAVVRDMTEKRSLEFQLQQYSQQLEKLVEDRTKELKYYSERLEDMVQERTAKLEAVNKELEQFAYTISHDLRAPLVCIEGFSDLLRDEARESLKAEHREWLDIILSSTRRMNKLIADLLELARVGRVVGQEVDVNVYELLEDIKQEFSLTIEKRHVHLSYTEEFPRIKTDMQRMRQVFQNLISNAIKYNDKEEVQITIRAEEKEHCIEYSVADNGMGIPPERIKDVFILFKRVHAVEEIEGTGAGLAIVKKIIESLGGTIWVESEVGVGSTFKFTIPK